MAADLSDNLVYDEPWGWMQPPVHALGALNLEQVGYLVGAFYDDGVPAPLIEGLATPL
jgi:hypothetical protein